MKTHQIVAGALADFLGRLVEEKPDLALYLSDFWTEFAARRGLDTADADRDWAHSMREPQVQPFELKLGQDNLRQIDALIQRNLRDVMVYQGRLHERYDGDRGVVRKEVHEGNAFTTAGVHDFIMALCRETGLVPERSIGLIFEFELLIKGNAPAMLAVTYGDPEAIGEDEHIQKVIKDAQLIARELTIERVSVASGDATESAQEGPAQAGIHERFFSRRDGQEIPVQVQRNARPE